jgi:hypothetical protein
MMNDDQSILAILTTAVSLSGLLWLVFWLYQDYCVDSFRQKIFELRDGLFDLAADGQIDFDNPAYGMMRRTMNGFIRFGHRLSFPGLLIFVFLQRSKTEGRDAFQKEWQRNTENLDHDQKRLLSDIRQHMGGIVLRHLLLSSPVFMVTIILPVFSWLLVRYWLQQALSMFELPISRLNTAAMAVGGGP